MIYLRSSIVICLMLLFPVTGYSETGVTKDTVIIGQSAALTGPAAAIGQAMRDGASTYFDTINAAGGVHGRKIKLVTMDDAFEYRLLDYGLGIVQLRDVKEKRRWSGVGGEKDQNQTASNTLTRL